MTASRSFMNQDVVPRDAPRHKGMPMITRSLVSHVLVGALAVSVGCSRTQRTLGGAAIGGASGAVIGDAVGGTGGAVIGGVGGAVAGGYIGRNY